MRNASQRFATLARAVPCAWQARLMATKASVGSSKSLPVTPPFGRLTARTLGRVRVRAFQAASFDTRKNEARETWL